MDVLQQRFAHYIAQQQLITSGDNVLAAVSGGIDSMVMLHLLHAEGINCAVAHCNFCLRGDESDGDELFVKEQAAFLGIPAHTIRFDAKGHAAQKRLSIQMAARELRYQWFTDLANQQGYHNIAIAHHRDDRIETLFINLSRGTGIRGLTSISPRNGKIIRPLLFASREEIIIYAQAHHISFREDSSNASDKYARNYIRHHVIPGLEQYFPGLSQTLERNIEHFAGIEAIYEDAVERFKKQIICEKDGLWHIDLPELMQNPSPSVLLYEILVPFGFSNVVVTDILKDTMHRSGRQFYSNTHRLLCDRQSLLIQEINAKDIPQEHWIGKALSNFYSPIHLKIDTFSMYPGFLPDSSQYIAYIDSDQLQYPLVLRKWQKGDKFRPIGMKNMKKVSDFLIDHKFSIIDKEQLWLLVSGGKIVWLVGYRIDDRFKITADTKRIIQIEYFPH